MDLLCERRGFSPAAAENMGMELIKLGKTFSGKERKAGQLKYIGVFLLQYPDLKLLFGVQRLIDEIRVFPA